jgi:hypothetical protein
MYSTTAMHRMASRGASSRNVAVPLATALRPAAAVFTSHRRAAACTLGDIQRSFQPCRSYSLHSSPHSPPPPPPPLYVRLHDYTLERVSFVDRVRGSFRKFIAVHMRTVISIAGIIGGVYAINWYLDDPVSSVDPTQLATVDTGDEMQVRPPRHRALTRLACAPRCVCSAPARTPSSGR